mmetsp:Transcript_15519/g.40094  ORF Transcript_15519/g.40094 Transcript_15519/m.40094 type:complete len:266 (-) Transcript_15519:238-1035(-)
MMLSRILASTLCRPVVSGGMATALKGCRMLSSLATRKALTLEQALTSNHLVLGELESPVAVQQLNSVRSAGDMLTKWQTANAVLVQATLRVLPQVGFTADAIGLQGYTESFAECVRTGSPEERTTLQQLNEHKWRVLLQNAFGVDPAPAIGLSKAREIVIDMVDALQDPALIRQVEESRHGLAARLSDPERQHMVARALVDVQAGVIARHGFEGDGGYAQAQVCLMDHATDAVVTASIAAATTNLYARAGIDLQSALRQAVSGDS